MQQLGYILGKLYGRIKSQCHKNEKKRKKDECEIDKEEGQKQTSRHKEERIMSWV